MGANSFLFEKTQIYIGGNNENDRVTSLESVPIHLKTKLFHFAAIMVIILGVPSFRIFNVVDCTCTNCSTGRSVFTYCVIAIWQCMDQEHFVDILESVS